MLTDLAVQNMRPGLTTRDIADGRDGLYLILQRSGHRAWAVRYRSKGRQIKLTLGTYPTLTLSQARIAAIEARARAKNRERYQGIIDAIGMTALCNHESGFASFADTYDTLLAIKDAEPAVIKIDDILDAIEWWFEEIAGAASLRLREAIRGRRRKQS